MCQLLLEFHHHILSMFYQFHEPVDEQDLLCAPSTIYPCFQLPDRELEQGLQPNRGMLNERLSERRAHLLWLKEGTLPDNHLTMQGLCFRKSCHR